MLKNYPEFNYKELLEEIKLAIKNNEIKKAIECIWIKIAKEDIYEKNIIIYNFIELYSTGTGYESNG